MLSVSSYSQAYVDECRAKLDVQLSAYKNLVTVATDPSRANEISEAKLESAIAEFEPLFFNNMVLMMDTYFTNRSRTMEKKDGNPLNEVRVICNSLLNNDGMMAADKTIKLDPTRSLLKFHVGDKIKLNEDRFARLSKAFFAEIETKYLPAE